MRSWPVIVVLAFVTGLLVEAAATRALQPCFIGAWTNPDGELVAFNRDGTYLRAWKENAADPAFVGRWRTVGSHEIEATDPRYAQPLGSDNPRRFRWAISDDGKHLVLALELNAEEFKNSPFTSWSVNSAFSRK